MMTSSNLLILFIIIRLNDISLSELTLSLSKELSQTHPECDYSKYTNGCKDSNRSDCVNNRCVCRLGYEVESSSGRCLRISVIGHKCENSRQCLEYDSNSLCFTSNDNFDEWVCLCKQDYYYDMNSTQKCLIRLTVGQTCHSSDQCLRRNSVCDSNHRCVCRYNHYFDHFSNQCKHNNSFHCNEDQEWNELIERCQTIVYYSHKGGGRGGGGRGGGRGGSGRGRGSSGGGGWGGRRGGGASVRGRSWWTTSWFMHRGSGGYSSGGSYYSEGEEHFAWDKLVIILVAILLIVLACCYCSYKFRQQDKEAELYWKNRNQRPVPKIVIKGTEDMNNAIINNIKRMSRTSEVGVPSDLRRSRSPSRGSQTQLLEETSANSGRQSIPTSPPPPYSPPNGSGIILPFASAPTPQNTSHSRPQSPRLQSSRPQSRSQSPLIDKQLPQNANHIVFEYPTDPTNPNPLSFASAMGPHSRPNSRPNSRPHSPSPSEPLLNPNPCEPVRHPSNSNLILPFATSSS